jgi:hypothetical protein
MDDREKAEAKADAWLDDCASSGCPPLPSRGSVIRLILSVQEERNAEVKRVVEEVEAEAKRDAVTFGPAITGWAFRELKRRLGLEENDG